MANGGEAEEGVVMYFLPGNKKERGRMTWYDNELFEHSGLIRVHFIDVRSQFHKFLRKCKTRRVKK